MKCKNAYNEDDFQDYFKKYKNICTDKKIADKNIQNIHKTRFCVDCDKAYQVITLKLNKPMLLTNPAN